MLQGLFLNRTFWVALVFVVAAAVLYALVSYLRFRQQQNTLLALQNSLQPGDRVLLSSGFLVQILSLDKKTALVLLDAQHDIAVQINRFAIAQKISDAHT